MELLLFWIFSAILILMFFKGTSKNNYISEEIMSELTVTRIEE